MTLLLLLMNRDTGEPAGAAECTYTYDVDEAYTYAPDENWDYDVDEAYTYDPCADD